ncbi:hybrid sensor histidine kinase/response regulator transcription factor [Sediminitomix flava]|uniref:histidine kinase n=1 Tax=Sediminitomix flava TaxID=379075 RepID=A0A315ZHH0_SEDFL|nr:hybrid sensor histidine kinase/response regulator transcription factor [Sediminitomix flava]PWJ44600.1 signal transduction histidine kinase [Sediminitomix flava]
MKMRRYLIQSILFLICLISGSLLQAQNALSFQNISLKTDIPQASINCITQDQEGYIWIGTWSGLYRYDGYEAVNYSFVSPEKFNSRKITCLLMDDDGILWIGTHVDGLFSYDTKQHIFTKYDRRSSFKVNINNILTINKADQKIWVGTEYNGLYILDLEHKKSLNIRQGEEDGKSLLRNQVSKIYTDNYGNTWIGTGAGLQFYDEVENSFHTIFKHDVVEYVYEMKEGRGGEIWVSSKHGLLSFIPDVEKIRKGEPVFYQVHSSSKDYNKAKNTWIVQPILLLNGHEQEEVLAGTSKGFLQLSLNGKGKHLEIKESGLSSLVIRSLYQDAQQNIWVGTEQGLHLLNSNQKDFQSIEIGGETRSLQAISSIAVTDEQIWLGTWGTGLMLKEKGKALKSVSLSSSIKALEDNLGIIYDIMLDFDDNLWVITKGGGIFCVNPHNHKNGKLEDVKHYYISEGGVRFDYDHPITISKDTRGRVYFGSWNGRIYFHDSYSEGIEDLELPEAMKESTNSYPITSILRDQSGLLWVGTRGGGVWALELSQSQKKVVKAVPYTYQNGLSDNFVNQVYQSKNGTIWIATENGLSYFDGNELAKINFITVSQKNPVMEINGMIEDDNGFLWLTTPKELIRMSSSHPEQNNYSFFDRRDGLINSAFMPTANAKGDDGEIYLGGIEGVDHFNPVDIELNYQLPQPQLTKFYLQNRVIQVGDSIGSKAILPKALSTIEEIELESDQNAFSFEFSGLQHALSEKCLYAFRLKGFEEEWTYTNSIRRKATYTNIPSGAYTFELLASNNDGIWNKKPMQVEIRVLPPIWERPLAYLIYASFLVLLIGYFWRQQQLKRVEELRKVSEQKEKEVDQLKLRFFTNISHEFRTPLTLIMGPLGKLVSDTKNPYHDYHLMMYRNTHRLLMLINRLMDFNKNETIGLDLNVGQSDFHVFIKNTFEQFQYKAIDRNIKYDLQVSEEVPKEIWYSKEIVENVLYNLLSNAFKFTPKSKRIQVAVGIEQKEAQPFVSISVIDEGKGIKKDTLPFIFDRYYSKGESEGYSTGIGLSFSKRLAQVHKGELVVDSKVGFGTTFKFMIPLTDVYSANEKTQKDATSVDSIVNWENVNTILKERLREQSSEEYISGRKIALVVDDNSEVRNFVRSLLEPDFKVVTAENGLVGLEKAQENIPDVIISDVMMPEMDGFEFCEKVKSDPKTDHIPVILLTALASEDNRLKGLMHGADSYIPKPLNSNHLMIRVNKLIERSSKLQKKFNAIQSNPKSEIPSTKNNEPTVEMVGETKETKLTVDQLPPMLQKAIAVIEANVSEPEWGVDEFCDEMNLSRMQLYRKLKATTGLSANALIRKIKLKRSAELLLEGELNIKQVTYEVGFADLKYFRKCFKEEFGVTPSEYIKRESNTEDKELNLSISIERN